MNKTKNQSCDCSKWWKRCNHMYIFYIFLCYYGSQNCFIICTHKLQLSACYLSNANKCVCFFFFFFLWIEVKMCAEPSPSCIVNLFSHFCFLLSHHQRQHLDRQAFGTLSFFCVCHLSLSGWSLHPFVTWGWTHQWGASQWVRWSSFTPSTFYSTSVTHLLTKCVA